MKRNARLELRLTESEKLQLSRLADAAKMDVSTYVRKRVLGSESVVPSVHTGVPAPPVGNEEEIVRTAPKPSTGPSAEWLAQRIRVLKPQHGPKAEAVARKEWAAL